MSHRRDFLKTAAGAGFAAWLGDIPGLKNLQALATEPAVTPDIVQFTSEIEPLVRLIETTPQEACFEKIAAQLRQGTTYRQLMAALFLAGIRNVNPQPPGFKFHCVFVIHAAHQLSLDAPAADRLLPFFWALDNFKTSQEQDKQQGDFVLRPVQGPLPAPEQASSEFHAAMEAWDEPRADRAIASLVRGRGADEIIEGMWRYGARDFRNIGHKAIFVANTWRTLQTIGWRHAEPAFRSLVLGLLDFGKSERVQDYAFDDQCYLANVERAQRSHGQLPGDWSAGTADPAATRELLDTFRTASVADSCQAVVDRLVNRRANAQAVWDAAHLFAGELMLRQRGIFGIHTVTSLNGLRYAFETASSPETRLLLLLQGVGWMGQFQRFMSGKNGGLADLRITELTPADIPQDPQQSAHDVLVLASSDPALAARKAFAVARAVPEPRELLAGACRMIVRKGTDAHDYKYPVAVMEDFRLVSPEWRPHMLATLVYHVPGITLPNSPVMQRAEEAVRTISS